jgi:hypothetical protein
MVVLGAHAPAGALEWTQYVATRPTIPGGCYGTAVVGIGDVNSDGCEDYAVANPARCASQGAQMYPRGSVEIRSGADGSILVELVAPNGAETFGRTIAKIGDVDDDGVPDIAIGEPGADVGNQSEAGAVHVYSGASGSEIWSFDLGLSNTAGARLGAAMADLGDISSDGYDDLIVGAPQLAVDPLQSGVAIVVPNVAAPLGATSSTRIEPSAPDRISTLPR